MVLVASLQMSIDNLYGVDGAEQNLAALIAFKTEFRDARAKSIGDVAGKINYVVNDPDLLPDQTMFLSGRLLSGKGRKQVRRTLTFGFRG